MNLRTRTVWSSDVQDESDINERGLIVSSKLAQAGYRNGHLLTSVDRATLLVKESLHVDMPHGYVQHVIPIPLASALFSRVSGGANMVFPSHSHARVDGFTLVLKGKLMVNGKELVEGDWFFSPAGCVYECAAGDSGVELLHAYSPPPPTT